MPITAKLSSAYTKRDAKSLIGKAINGYTEIRNHKIKSHQSPSTPCNTGVLDKAIKELESLRDKEAAKGEEDETVANWKAYANGCL